MKKEHFVTEFKLKYVLKKRDLPSLGKIRTSNDAYNFAFGLFNADTIRLQEEFLAVYLNYGSEIIGYHFLSKGSVSGTVVDVKLIVASALSCVCSNVIISHNHPSANILPSKADKDITKRLMHALKYFNIALLDHIIVSPDKPAYFSFVDEGLL